MWEMGNDGNVHSLVNHLDRHALVDLLHSLAGILHCSKGLLVDIGGFDRVYLRLQLQNLGGCLLEGLLMNLLPSQSILRGCHINKMISMMDDNGHRTDDMTSWWEDHDIRELTVLIC